LFVNTLFLKSIKSISDKISKIDVSFPLIFILVSSNCKVFKEENKPSKLVEPYSYLNPRVYKVSPFPFNSTLDTKLPEESGIDL